MARNYSNIHKIEKQPSNPAAPISSGAPLASVSVDLDNLWSYLKTQGVVGWQEHPGYLERITPRILACFERLGLTSTFFIVGRDAADGCNADVMRSISQAGHEIANHTFEHEPWLHLYSAAQLETDFSMSEEAIEAATGQRAFGFRGPGFSSSPEVLNTLVRRGYQYDASVLPTPLGPLARLAFSLSSGKLSAEERRKRSGLYGPLSNAVRPLRPFHIRPGLVEVPVTTMPLVRAPIHLSYLFFLAQRSESLARLYWSTAITMCRALGVGPSLLLHPTDFFDANEVPEMAFFPGMKIPVARKQALVEYAITSLQRHWNTGTMIAHARSAMCASPMPKTVPHLATSRS